MNKNRVAHYHLLCVIVNRGKAAKVVQIAKGKGVPGATISLGWGTVESSFFDFLGGASQEKDIVHMVSDPDTIDQAIHALEEELQLHKPNHGIAYIMELTQTSGVHRLTREQFREEQGDETMKHLITVIVERGRADDVMAAAKQAGATGGTIVNARGSGVHETMRLFNMEIVPEKEMVLILCNTEASEAIMSQIEQEIQIHEPGHGIMYLQPVLKSIGARQ